MSGEVAEKAELSEQEDPKTPGHRHGRWIFFPRLCASCPLLQSACHNPQHCYGRWIFRTYCKGSAVLCPKCERHTVPWNTPLNCLGPLGLEGEHNIQNVLQDGT